MIVSNNEAKGLSTFGIPLSVLDVSPIIEGGTVAESLHNTLDLAQHAERWGYKRYWLAEHHNSPSIASSATSIRRILGALKQQGYVVTKEGIGGGYMLNCDPSTTTLAEVYRAICEGMLKPHWVSGNPSESCLVSANMQQVMDYFFCEAEQHYVAYLEQHTLQSVLDRLFSCQQNGQAGDDSKQQ